MVQMEKRLLLHFFHHRHMGLESIGAQDTAMAFFSQFIDCLHHIRIGERMEIPDKEILVYLDVVLLLHYSKEIHTLHLSFHKILVIETIESSERLVIKRETLGYSLKILYVEDQHFPHIEDKQFSHGCSLSEYGLNFILPQCFYPSFFHFV